MTPRSQGSDLIKLADFRPVAADPARYLNHIGQIASKRLQDIPKAVAEFSINGRPVTVPEHLPLPQSVSTGLCRASDFIFRLFLASSIILWSARACIAMCPNICACPLLMYHVACLGMLKHTPSQQFCLNQFVLSWSS